MSVKEQFYNQRPAVLFDPRASQRIDPRFTFTRNSTATYVDNVGVMRNSAISQPRLDYDPTTGECLGLLLEDSRTNTVRYSTALTTDATLDNTTATANYATAPDGTTTATRLRPIAGLNQFRLRKPHYNAGNLAVSVFFKPVVTQTSYGDVHLLFYVDAQNSPTIFNTHTFQAANGLSVEEWRDGWYRGSFVFKPVSGANVYFEIRNNGNVFAPITIPATGNEEILLWGAQVESIPEESLARASSFIPTTTSSATRAADLLSVDSIAIPPSGSIYIDAQANSTAVNDTLLSVANSSDEKLLLQTQAPASLYNSLALVYAIDDTFEPTLPFPVPEPGDQRNIITWGDNNYHYQKSNYRKTPSLTASIPENLDRIGIGHDVTDPTKGFNGTLGRLYLWANELPPEIARGLVRGNITVPLNADDGNVIPVAAHALIFNTQGDAFNGDKVIRFQLLGSNNSVSIDWNDGTIETYAGSAANTTITHTYETPGLYLVTITGVFENIKLGNFTGSQASDLVNVVQNGPDWSPTNLTDLYNGCTLLQNEALDDFPDTSLITQYVRAFQNCTSLTSFPLINTAAGTNFIGTWNDCTSLTSFPLIDTAAGTNFGFAWLNCNSLTSFPLINTAAGTNFIEAWQSCSSLTSFPLINTAAGTIFQSAWRNCSSLTSFPLINTAAGTNFALAWSGCSSLTSFPLINTAAGTNYDFAWRNCSSLTSFPLINTAAGTNFCVAWLGCSSLTAFPALDFDAAVGLASDASNTFTGFRETWFSCGALADFPANLFDNTTCTRYLNAFTNCALTAQSIENILVSINTANTSNGNLSLQGGTNAVKTSWTANANTAYDALVARGWTITFRP
jgi:hypothetical protein